MSGFDVKGLLPGALASLGLDLDQAAQSRLLKHLELIAKWNRVYNLTAVRDPADMLTHHLLDSLAAVRPLAAHLAAAQQPVVPISVQPDSPQMADPRVLDVGAGAGLPGVTLAIALPPALRVRVICVDAVAKKAGFIRQVGAELGLSNLQALHGRIEALSLPPMDVITCRAFASLRDTVELTRSQLAPHGVWMALKGLVPESEMTELPSDIEVFHVEQLKIPHLDAQRCLVWMRRRTAFGPTAVAALA